MIYSYQFTYRNTRPTGSDKSRLILQVNTIIVQFHSSCLQMKPILLVRLLSVLYSSFQRINAFSFRLKSFNVCHQHHKQHILTSSQYVIVLYIYYVIPLRLLSLARRSSFFFFFLFQKFSEPSAFNKLQRIIRLHL